MRSFFFWAMVAPVFPILPNLLCDHMTQFGIIQSPLSQTLTEDGITIEIIIFRDADEDEWTLEILDHNDGSTIWEDGFETEEEALEEALRAIEEDGIASFAKALAINVH